MTIAPPLDMAVLDGILAENRGQADMLIQVLLGIQKEYGWLPREGIFKVARELNVPLARVYHVATFYKVFSLTPRGRHLVTVCLGTACHVHGAPKLLERVQQLLGIEHGGTTDDLRFSLEAVNCLGCCALGPVMVVDGRYFGKLPVTEAEKILARYE